MKHRIMLIGAAIAALLSSASDADACSRVLYVGDTTVSNPDSVLRIVGRSLDWKTLFLPIYMYIRPECRRLAIRLPIPSSGLQNTVPYMLWAMTEALPRV